ncbi:flavin reductase family protein [Thalassotalea ganghwensis]
MIINFDNYSANQRYHLMTQTIIPRPIAWALTRCGNDAQNESAPLNLAPFSYFSAIASEPPILMISIGKKPTGELKDTIVNVKDNGYIVIHIANEQHADLVTQTAATLAHGHSELEQIEKSMLETVDFDGFPLPRLAQCDIAYGCKLYEIKELGAVPQSLLFAEVKQLYISPNVMTEQDNRIKVHADKVNPLARLGASEYAGITTPFKKTRPF